MRSCLLWLSLLLVVLAGRSLASPYFDEGESVSFACFFPFFFLFQLRLPRNLSRAASREDEVSQDVHRAGSLIVMIRMFARRPARPTIARVFSGSRCGAREFRSFARTVGEFTFMGQLVRTRCVFRVRCESVGGTSPRSRGCALKQDIGLCSFAPQKVRKGRVLSVK